jgi:cell division protease FtsH
MRVIAGPERRTRLLSEAERTITAYHELGHALVGHFLEHTDPVHKVTIVSRGQALGLTVSLPSEDTYLTTRSALKDRLAMTLGGRAAEELVFDEITTGAANDLENVTKIAKRMVMEFGMSDTIGPRVLGRSPDSPFLGREMGGEADYSPEVARTIDDEIGRLIAQAHARALTVLRDHQGELHKLAAILLERETLDRDQFERLLAGAQPADVLREPIVPRAPVDERAGKSPGERPSPRPRPFPAPGVLAAIPPGQAQRRHGPGAR